MKMSIAKEWDEFERIAIHPDAPPEQHREMRRAFYAGAQCLLLMLTAELDPEPETTETDMEIMIGIADELKEFSEQILQGKA